jgi:hypothetical protein
LEIATVGRKSQAVGRIEDVLPKVADQQYLALPVLEEDGGGALRVRHRTSARGADDNHEGRKARRHDVIG